MIALLISVVATAALAEFLLRAFVVPIPNTTPHRTFLVYTEPSRDIAVGDSHTYRAFLGASPFLNLGRAGSTVGEMATVVRAYNERHDLGRAIIQASPQLLALPIQRNPLDGEFALIRLPVTLVAFEPLIATHLGRLSDIGLLREERRDAEKSVDRVGTWHLLTETERVADARGRAKAHRPRWDARTRRTAAAYETMLSYLSENNVQTCMVRPPVSAEYLKLTERDMPFWKTNRFFRELASRHSLPFVDFRDLDLALSASDFLNADHITPASSPKYLRAVETACFGLTGPE